MIRICVPRGERVRVCFEEDEYSKEVGGEFLISYDFQGDGKLKVEADLPDTEGRQGVIYEEDFGGDQVDEHGNLMADLGGEA